MGARIIVAGRDHSRGEAVVGAIRSEGGEASFIAGELIDASSARSLARSALDAAGGVIDVLVNNAGVGAMAPTSGFDEQLFDAIFATNVKAPFYLVSEIAPVMTSRGRGSIVNVSSMAAEHGVQGLAAYGASKAALNALTRSWTAEFGPGGVRINCVSPGMVRTPPVESLGTAVMDQIGVGIPAGSIAEPQQIASVVAFLASDASSHIFGAVLNVDGGRSAI
jgi:NAD(P)-dependent dehydrogenase (short-subunit alcohol dehydrogenase family)